MEAVLGFLGLGWWVLREARAEGRFPLLGCFFAGNAAVALVGDPIANWALTALYSDRFLLLPRAFGLGLSPAQSWAVLFAYPWCFPMLAYGGRALAALVGVGSPRGAFIAGAVVAAAVFSVFVYVLFVPNQVIVYQRTVPGLALWSGTPGQLHLLDVLGVALYIGACSAMLASDAARALPASGAARVLVAGLVLVGLFLVAFTPALVARLLELDRAAGFTRPPFTTVALY